MTVWDRQYHIYLGHKNKDLQTYPFVQGTCSQDAGVIFGPFFTIWIEQIVWSLQSGMSLGVFRHIYMPLPRSFFANIQSKFAHFYDLISATVITRAAPQLIYNPTSDSFLSYSYHHTILQSYKKRIYILHAGVRFNFVLGIYVVGSCIVILLQTFFCRRSTCFCGVCDEFIDKCLVCQIYSLQVLIWC